MKIHKQVISQKVLPFLRFRYLVLGIKKVFLLLKYSNTNVVKCIFKFPFKADKLLLELVTTDLNALFPLNLILATDNK